MDITKAIAENLSTWMKNHPGLDTIKKLSSKSGVGFGTVRRARNGDGNITVQNLEAIASAFGRRATDLITTPKSFYSTDTSNSPLIASDNIALFSKPDTQSAYMKELLSLVDSMNDQGRWQLIGQAKLLATSHPKAKANPVS